MGDIIESQIRCVMEPICLYDWFYPDDEFEHECKLPEGHDGSHICECGDMSSISG